MMGLYIHLNGRPWRPYTLPRALKRTELASPVGVWPLQNILSMSNLLKKTCLPDVAAFHMCAASDSILGRRRRCYNFMQRSFTVVMLTMRALFSVDLAFGKVFALGSRLSDTNDSSPS